MLTIMPITAKHSSSFKAGKLPNEMIHRYSESEIKQIADGFVKSTPEHMVTHAIGYGMKQLCTQPEEIVQEILKSLQKGDFDYLRGFFLAFKEEPYKNEELSAIDKFFKECPYISDDFSFIKPPALKKAKPDLRQRLLNAWKALKGN